LLEKYNLVQQYKEELESIDEDSQACEEASKWLDKNRKQLISYALGHIFNSDYQLKQFSNVQASRETAQSFQQDLDAYLRWLGHYLHMGTPPADMPKGVIRLGLPKETYIFAFVTIRNDRIAPSFGLSELATAMLTSYINRFLIKRSLEIDALGQ
jgi:hypothetical protein